jgi:hypothetical protein
MRCPIVIAVTIDDSAVTPEAFFSVDGDSYLTGAMTRLNVVNFSTRAASTHSAAIG